MTGYSKTATMIISSPPQCRQCSIGKMFTDSPHNPHPRIRRPRSSRHGTPASDLTSQRPHPVQAGPPHLPIRRSVLPPAPLWDDVIPTAAADTAKDAT
jgi:hypothetical protein